MSFRKSKVSFRCHVNYQPIYAMKLVVLEDISAQDLRYQIGSKTQPFTFNADIYSDVIQMQSFKLGVHLMY